ncbi:MAG: hypothetical protein DBX60_01740 [Bacillota bacterium]|nr:MAG: hypothetical protein DBX60_01740 [Bacillota bacterium]
MNADKFAENRTYCGCRQAAWQHGAPKKFAIGSRGKCPIPGARRLPADSLSDGSEVKVFWPRFRYFAFYSFENERKLADVFTIFQPDFCTKGPDFDTFSPFFTRLNAACGTGAKGKMLDKKGTKE